MSLRNHRARPDDLSALAPRVASGTDVIQPAKSGRQVVGLGKCALAGGFSCAIDVYDHPGVPCSIHQPSRLLVGRQWAGKQIIEKERAQRFDWDLGERCQKAREC